MKKLYILIILEIIILSAFGATFSFAKYTLNCSAKLFQIDSLSDELFDTTSPGTITGKILTQHSKNEHLSLIQVYKSSDVNHEQLVTQVYTNTDGSFSISLTDIQMYDIVISKFGYLNYTVLQIPLKHGKTCTIPNYDLKAGDLVVDGKIDDNDWYFLLNNEFLPITEKNRICDLNEDNSIDGLDRLCMVKNQNVSAETVVWENLNI